MTDENLVSCYIPAFNPGPEFERTLRSVANSTLKPYVLVVDDASTPEIHVNFEALGLRGEVLRLEVNGGHFKASNIALRELNKRKFKYVARLDADDMVAPERFAKQKAFLDNNPEFNLVASAAFIVNEKDDETGIWPALNGRALIRAMARNSVICHPTIMQRGDYIQKSQPYRELRRAADYEYLMRAAVRREIYVLEEPLLHYRVHQKSLSFTNYRGQLLARLATQRRFLDQTKIEGVKGIIRTLVILCFVSVFPHRLLGKIRERVGMTVKSAGGKQTS